jgi:hypothetical protein
MTLPFGGPTEDDCDLIIQTNNGWLFYCHFDPSLAQEEIVLNISSALFGGQAETHFWAIPWHNHFPDVNSYS